MDEIISWHMSISTDADRCKPKSLSEAEDRYLPALLEQKCSSDIVQLSIVDFAPDAQHDTQDSLPTSTRTQLSCRRRMCNSASEVEDVLKLPKPRIRIISIFSDTSFGHLHVTPEILRNIFKLYKVSVEVCSMLMSLGAAPEVIEGVSSCTDFQVDSVEGSGTIFQIRYPELNGRAGAPDPWSLRQTGVYHHRDLDFDLYLLFQPIARDCSEIERRLQSYVAPGTSPALKLEMARISTDPSTLFPILFSVYLTKWRWYLRSLAKECEGPSEAALSLTLHPSIKASEKTANTRFARLMTLGDVMDRMVRAHAYCEGNLDVIRTIQELGGLSDRTRHELKAHWMKLHGLIEGCIALKAQVKNVQDLLGNAIMLQTQKDATEIQKEMSTVTEQMHGLSREATQVHKDMSTVTKDIRNLSQGAAKDSAFISVISVLTALYVPGSFVGTLFGMNFFKFSDTGSRIQVAQDFWIFVVIWIPLTIVNGFIFYLVFWYDADKNDNVFTSPWTRIKQNRKKAMASGD